MRRGADISSDRIDAVAFIAVVATTAISTLSVIVYRRIPFTPAEAALNVLLAGVFVLIGTFGYSLCRRANSFVLSGSYFAVQTALATSLLAWHRGGLLWIILLPLAGQSVVLLPRRWTVIICLVLAVCAIGPLALASGWQAALVIGSIVLAGEIFVVAFSQIAVAERTARRQIEHLAVELESANQSLREYSQSAEQVARVHERNRLAREIHDSLGHYLTVINLQIEAIRVDLPLESENQAALAKTQALVRAALADVRRSCSALRAHPQADLSLGDSVALLVAEHCDAGLSAELIVAGDPRPLDPQVELAFFRIAQEGLTNVRRHAHATHTTVLLDYRDDRSVRLTVRDDGVGLTKDSDGFGLAGIRERVTLLGGYIEALPEPGLGFTLKVELPVS